MGFADYFGDPVANDSFTGRGAGASYTAQDLTRRIVMLTDHVKRLRKAPKMAATLAQLNVADDDLIQAARSSGMWEEIRRQRTNMNFMPEERQMRVWSKMGHEQRALLRQSGYTPIDERHAGGGGGLFGGIANAIGGTYHLMQSVGYQPFADKEEERRRSAAQLGAVRHQVPGAEAVHGALGTAAGATGQALGQATGFIGQGLGEASDAYRSLEERAGPLEGAMQTGRIAGRDVLGAFGESAQEGGRLARNAMQWANVAGQSPAHFYRYMQEGYERHGDKFFLDPTYWDMKEFSDIWEETGTRMGEGYWPDKIHDRVEKILPGDDRAQQLAKRLASGDTPEEVAGRLAKPGTRAYEQAYYKIAERIGDSDFKEAMRTLELGKVSFGRDMARMFGLEEGTDLYNGVSGGLDLTATILLDPTLAVGKARKAYIAARAFQLGEVELGLNRLRLAEEATLADNIGTDWESKIKDMSFGQIALKGGKSTAMGEAVTRAFAKRGAVDEFGNLADEELAAITREVPATKRAIDPLRKYDSALRYTRIGVRKAELGRDLTAREIAEIPGISNMRDYWGFFNTVEGRKTLLNGSWGGFTREGIHMPRLTATGLQGNKAMIAIEEAVDWARNGVVLKTPVREDEVVPGFRQAPIPVSEAVATPDQLRARDLVSQYEGHFEEYGKLVSQNLKTTPGQALPDLVEPHRQAMAAADAWRQTLSTEDQALLEKGLGQRYDAFSDPEPGMRRLFRVKSGLSDLPDLPEHVDPFEAQMRNVGTWWTDDLGHARSIGTKQGEAGRLFFVDAPDDVVREVADDMAALPGREFRIIDPRVEATQRELGHVADWVMVADRGKLDRARRWFLAPAANLVYFATHGVPQEPTISTFGSDFVPKMERMLNMGFDGPTTRAWMAELLAVEDPAARREMMKAAMDQMFYATGWYETEAGREKAAQYLYGINQMYAGDGIDMMRPLGGGTAKRVALDPVKDHADGFAVPMYRDMLANAQRVNFLQRFDGAVNREMVDAFMGTYWKPSVLLRLSFIPRAAGEEVLTSLLRFPNLLTEQWLLRPLADRYGEPLWLFKQMEGGARYLQHYLGEEWGDYVENMAHVISHQASGWVRGMARAAITPEMMDYSRTLAKEPAAALQRAKAVPAVGGGIYQSELPKEGELIKTYFDPERETFAYHQHGVSKFEWLEKERREYKGYLATNVAHHLGSTPYEAAYQAQGIFVAPEQLDQLELALANNDVARADWERLGNPTMDRVVQDIRATVNSGAHDGKYAGAIRRYKDLMSAGPDEKNARQAALALRDARNLASSPSERLAVEIMEAVPSDVREALLVNEHAFRQRMGLVDETQDVTLMNALNALPPADEGMTRAYVAAPMHPGHMPESMWGPEGSMKGRRLAWHDDPDNALFHAFDGRRADPGYQLYYVDYDQTAYDVARMAEQEAELVTPTEPVTQTAFGEIARHARMSADEELVARLQPVPGFSIGSPLDESERAVLDRLMDETRAGDVARRDELMTKSVNRGLGDLGTNPATAHFVRENPRSIQTQTGLVMESPPVEGHTRFYVLLANDQGMQDLPKAEVEGVAKKALAQQTPPGEHAVRMRDSETWGLAPYQPASSWATRSRSEMDSVRHALSHDNPNNLAVGIIDVPDGDVARIAEHGFGETELPNWRAADEFIEGAGRQDFGRAPMEPWPGWSVQYHGAANRIPGDVLEPFGGRGSRNLFGGAAYTSEAKWLSKEYMRGENPALYTVQWLGESEPRLLDLEQAMPDDLHQAAADWFYANWREVQALGNRDFENFAERTILDRATPGFETQTSADYISDFYKQLTHWYDSTPEQNALANRFRDEVLGTRYDVMRYDGGKRLGGREHNAFVWIKEEKLGLHGVPGELNSPLAIDYSDYLAAKADYDNLMQRYDANPPPPTRYETRIHDETGLEYQHAVPSPEEEAYEREFEEKGRRLYASESGLRGAGYNPDKPGDMAKLASMHDHRRYGDVADQARNDWAAGITANVNQLSSSPVDGRTLHEIGPQAFRKGSYDIGDIGYSNIAEQHLPTGVIGPQEYVYDPNLWDKIVQKGFGFINNMVGAIARKPLFDHNAAKRFSLAKKMLGPLIQDPEAGRNMLALARSVQGRQERALSAYREVYGQISRIDPKLLTGKLDAEAERFLHDLLPGIKVDGISDGLLTQVKRHFASMSGEDLDVVRAYTENYERLNKIAMDVAMDGAIADTIPFIDDHKIRSQFSDIVRNIAPFHFAEEQMLKRWARVLVHSPEALRRAQLTYMGFRHAGVIRQNDYGDDVWTVPGSAQTQMLFTKALEGLTGKPYEVPVSVPFTGEVKYTLPGFNRVGVPSFSPVLSIPMTLLARTFPELKDVNQTLFGQQAGRSLPDQFFPVSAMRAYRAATSSYQKDAQYASAMIQVMQYMEANDLTPEPPKADSGARARIEYRNAQDEYIQRVKNWTRIMLVQRAIFGFVSPAAPQMEVPKDFSQEFTGLLRNLPYEEAMRVFMKRHPDGTPYTVFATDAPSGAPMPTTKAAGDFLDHNHDYVNKYRAAAPWLLPPAERDDPTSLSVYAEQVKMGLRLRKSPQEWVNDLAFSQAAPEYFHERDRYERHRLAATSTERRKQVDRIWNDWKDSFLKMHPLFQQQVQSREAHNRRINVLEETRAALNDPDRPDIAQEETLGLMVDEWYRFQNQLDRLKGNRTANAIDRRSKIRIIFSNWGTTYIRHHPTLAAYWHRNIEPEIGLTPADKAELEVDDRAA